MRKLYITYVCAAATAVVLALASTAAGFWTATGTGTGTATTQAATQAVTLAAGTATAQLFPGGNGDVAAQVTNPNNAGVTVGSLVLDTSQGTNGFAVDAGHAGCTLTGLLTYTTQTNGGSGFTFPAGTSPLTLTNAVSMSSGAANACQGAVFTIFLKAGP